MLTRGFLVYWIGKCLLVEPHFSLERQFTVHCLIVTIRHSSHRSLWIDRLRCLIDSRHCNISVEANLTTNQVFDIHETVQPSTPSLILCLPHGQHASEVKLSFRGSKWKAKRSGEWIVRVE